MDKMKQETPDLTARNVEKIAALFPNCVTEMRDEKGKVTRGIDFAMLKQMLSPAVVEGAEHYEFSWVGKKAALVEANKPIRKTLRPCPEESKDWDTTENLYIEGDNLEVLKLLQESYLGKVKMIYIDPPYNTGNDFIYVDNFRRSQQEEDLQAGALDEEGNHLFKNTDSNGRFHSDWCSMMYSRLMLARNLLADDGVVFISIDDNEQANLKHLCDEIFGAENFVADFLWKKKSTTSNVSGAEVSSLADYTLCFKRTKAAHLKPRIRESSTRSHPYHDEQGFYRLAVIEKKDSGGYRRDTMKFSILGHFPREGKRWQIGEAKAREYEKKGRFVYDGEKILLKIYSFEDKDTYSANPNLLENCGTTDSASRMVNQELFGIPELFDNPKPVELIGHLASLVTDSDSLILDFFSGSATTAHAVMQLNAEDGGKRKFIMVQLPEPCDKKSSVVGGGGITLSARSARSGFGGRGRRSGRSIRRRRGWMWASAC